MLEIASVDLPEEFLALKEGNTASYYRASIRATCLEDSWKGGEGLSFSVDSSNLSIVGAEELQPIPFYFQPLLNFDGFPCARYQRKNFRKEGDVSRFLDEFVLKMRRTTEEFRKRVFKEDKPDLRYVVFQQYPCVGEVLGYPLKVRS
jgi:hypothetical protein